MSASGRYDFTPISDPTAYRNAVQLEGVRDSSRKEIQTFFPTFVGRTNFEMTRTSVSTQVEVEIALVLDRSGSMAYADTEPAVFPPIPQAAPADWEFGHPAPSQARWRDAVFSVDAFLAELGKSPLNERVSLTTYANGASLDTPLTKDFNIIKAALQGHTDKLDGGGTNIAAGLMTGESSLVNSREFAAKVVVLLTDGQRTVGIDPRTWAYSLKNNGVMIVTVTFSQEADQNLMKEIASIGGGFHVHAKSSSDLVAAFKSISRQLPTLLTQ